MFDWVYLKTRTQKYKTSQDVSAQGTEGLAQTKWQFLLKEKLLI